ncbi:MAG: Unknown protein [uncultured Sulfurovum sp.]|uniref:DUF86 domain-containing protein n=1 Tax=uncultured Sulfurovum sp. TaxID=269237 RepID=A0A6S6UGR1_9BACT|nr:MAG: Unknown protein [uncultured Sulfurovum sp.]
MSSKNLAKIEFILEMIENIEIVCKRHSGVNEALDDQFEGRAAILMFLLQIGESLQKLDFDDMSKYNLDREIKGAYDVRNFIAHDYEGVNIVVIEDILKDNLPELKIKMQKIFDTFPE